MITKRTQGDFARSYRPGRISEVYGQEEIKKVIGRGLDEVSLPTSMLFYGESGVGKTSMARIVAAGLNCRQLGPTSEPCLECDSCIQAVNDNHFAFMQFNSAQVTGVDHIRYIADILLCHPLDGSKYEIVVFDECHRLSKNAQDSLLKVIEDSHPDNYFILCSTQPDPILDTLKGRCMPLEFKPIEDHEMSRLLTDICVLERLVCANRTLKKIIEGAKGKARNALYLLQKAVLGGEIERLPSPIHEAMQLVRTAFSG